jgi:hypothetical protein
MDTECVETIADLKKLPHKKARCVIVLGYHEPSDGGGGQFFWDGSFKFPAGEDFGIIIKPASLAPSESGRWRRIFDEPISVKWFGAAGKGSSLDTDAIQNAINAIPPGGELIIPSGTYKVSSLHIKSPISLQGSGKPKITSDKVDIPIFGFRAVILVDDGQGAGLSGDIKISNLDVEYTGVIPSPNPKLGENQIDGIYARVKGRFKCEDLEIYGASYCGILGVSDSVLGKDGQIILENVYCHHNGYAGVLTIGLGGVVAMPGCRFENNGGKHGVGWNGSDGYGISIHNGYGIVIGCRFAGNWGQQIDCHGVTGRMIVVGNSIKFNGNEGENAHGISLTVVESVLVNNNILEGASNKVLGAIAVVGNEKVKPSLSNVTISCNIIQDFSNLLYSIRVGSMDTKAIIIKDNQIMNCQVGHAILVEPTPVSVFRPPHLTHRHIARQVRIEDNVVEDSGPITIIAASELWFSGNSWTWSKTEMEWIDSTNKVVKINPPSPAFYIGQQGTKTHIGRVHIDRPNRVCGPAIPYDAKDLSNMFTSVPTRFSWGIGDKAPNIQPKEGGVTEWICTTPGSAEEVRETHCTTKASSESIDQIADVSNLLPGDFIKVSGEHFGDEDAVEVLDVKGYITIGTTKYNSKDITNVANSYNAFILDVDLFKIGDYIRVDEVTFLPDGSIKADPVTFGDDASKFVQIDAKNPSSATITVTMPAKRDLAQGVIGVNRCTVKTDAKYGVTNGTLSWQRAVFSSVGSLKKV